MDSYKNEGVEIYEQVTEWPNGFGKEPRVKKWKLICTCVDEDTAIEITGILNAHEWAS